MKDEDLRKLFSFRGDGPEQVKINDESQLQPDQNNTLPANKLDESNKPELIEKVEEEKIIEKDESIEISDEISDEEFIADESGYGKDAVSS